MFFKLQLQIFLGHLGAAGTSYEHNIDVLSHF